MVHQTLKENGITLLNDRFDIILSNKYFLEEFDIVSKMERGFEYYSYLIKNTEIKDNKKNSYILWAVGKTDVIDLNKPVDFKPGNYTLPDIDVDFPPSIRSQVFDYLRTKYGDHRVCQMATFGRLQGKSILKEILRINELCSNDQMNEITKLIPNDAEISDELENMEKPSTIIWALENVQKIRAYCYIGENDELEGEFAKAFEQAIRMEGVFKSMGKHAAGVVISSDSLEEICPMVKAARGSEKIAGMEMADLEAIGCVKFDILGVSLLSKVANTVNSVNTGEIK